MSTGKHSFYLSLNKRKWDGEETKNVNKKVSFAAFQCK